MKISIRSMVATAVVALSMALSSMAQATTQWDLPMTWPDTSFFTKNAKKFATEVERVTEGRVKITVHGGGSLGFKGPEMLAALRDGLVPIGNLYLPQQVGEEPVMGLEAIPFLMTGLDEAQQLHVHFRPLLSEVVANHNQKILYAVPWPPPGIYTHKAINSKDDLASVKIRTYDKNSTSLFGAIGATPVQLPWGEVVPSLAAGTIDGVFTSSTSGADGKFWEFLTYFTATGGVLASDSISVNLDAWNELSANDRVAIDDLAKSFEVELFAELEAEDIVKRKILTDNGLIVNEPSDELLAQMRDATKGDLDAFIEANPEAGPVLRAFLKSVGRL